MLFDEHHTPITARSRFGCVPRSDVCPRPLAGHSPYPSQQDSCFNPWSSSAHRQFSILATCGKICCASPVDHAVTRVKHRRLHRLAPSIRKDLRPGEAARAGFRHQLNEAFSLFCVCAYNENMTCMWKQIAAIFGLGAFVFAQLAVVVYACPASAPGKATMTQVVAAGAAQPCQNNMDGEHPNLCKQHCEQASQSVDNNAVQAAIEAPTLPLIAVVLPPKIHLASKATVQGNLLASVAEPPLSIRFCTFRI